MANFSRGDTYNIPTANDPDADSTIVYTLDPADPWFEVDPNTGQLRVREDCGQSCVKIQDCYYGEVTVWANNPDKPNVRASLQIRVTMLTTATTDKIDSPISASDPDWGDSGKVDYTITNSTHFGIDGDGQIYVITPPDYESSSGTRICIQVVARDRGTPARSASTVVCIDVTNVNDNDPVFDDSYKATVYDRDPVGKFVVKVTARDADPGTLITYDLETPNPYFRIDTNTGNITVAKTIDRADIIATRGGSIVSLRVRASDSEKTSTTQLLVNVLAMNEHTPRFTRDQYEASVDEETISPTVPVLTVQAEDEDLPREPVNYFLQASNYSDHFEINSESGAITLVRSIDRERLSNDTIKLIVVAVDSGNPPPRRSSSATVLIRVNDINDNAPHFDPNVAEIRMMQNFTAGIVHNLPQARDADLNPQIGYRLSEGASHYFNLDSNTATLTTRLGCSNCVRNQDYKWTVITVTAFNRDKPDLTSQLQVTVYLLALGNSTSEPRVDEVVFTEKIFVNRDRVKISDTVFVTEKFTGKLGANYSIDADNHTLSVFAVTEGGEVILSNMPPPEKETYNFKIRAVNMEGSKESMVVNLLVTFVDDPYLDDKGVIAISVICAIALLIIILVVVHIIWWKTRHKKDKDQVMMGEDVPRGCCCGKPLIAVPVSRFNGESSM
ncbi:protocadherin Fat 4-like [Liolophura sinensis]|uniref:protocadherin Fat 4-like n=1 Tax=Liolophura sinensis TaxID=3198878 RepID=UPI0031580338